MRAWLALGLIVCSAASDPATITPNRIEASRGVLAGGTMDKWESLVRYRWQSSNIPLGYLWAY
jgi:hypothetical protein